MTSPSDCVAIIPAKGTSRRIPQKNLALCAGKSLVRRTLECAVVADIFSAYWLTSDDDEILQEGRMVSRKIWPLYRPIEFSADGVGVAAVVAGLLGYVGYHLHEIPDAFCILWPTSPLRTPEMVRQMWYMFDNLKMPSFHSVTLDRIHDGTALFMRTATFLQRLSLDYRDGDPCFAMSPEFVCDVNTPEDLAEAERRLLAREAACPSS